MSAPAQPDNKMPYVRLGKSGLKISKLILGCMSYGSSEWQGWVLNEEESLLHIQKAYEAGINTFDTADVYSNGDSEVIIGKAIKKHSLPRENIVIMSKVFNLVKRTHGETIEGGLAGAEAAGYVNQQGLSRKHIFASVDASLKRLDLDYIDLLQCHRFDYDTPIEETMRALHDVVQSGKVRYIGMSSCFAYQFHQMQNYAITNGLTPFISMQNYHNALYREEEREMLPTCRLFGVGIVPWSPLARGALTRSVDADATTKRTETDPNYKGRGLDKPDEATKEIRRRVEAIAKKRGISMASVALAWSLTHPDVTAPIIGSTSLKHLEDLIAGVHVKLTQEEFDHISEPYKAQTIIGHS